MNQNIFREYDIRGIVAQDLTDETVAVLGKLSARFSIKTARNALPSVTTRAKACRVFVIYWSKVSMKPAATWF